MVLDDLPDGAAKKWRLHAVVATTAWRRHFFAAPSGRSSRTISSGASWSYEKSSRPSARSGNHRPYRHINDAADENKPGRADNEGTDTPEANATEKDAVSYTHLTR